MVRGKKTRRTRARRGIQWRWKQEVKGIRIRVEFFYE